MAPMGAPDAYCPNCGLARLTDDTLLVRREPVVVVDEAAPVVVDDATPWLWVGLIALGAMALLLAVWLATNDGGDTPPATTVPTTVTTIVGVNPAPSQAPVFIPVPNNVDANEPQDPQTIIIEREAPATTQAPTTTSAPATTTTAAP